MIDPKIIDRLPPAGTSMAVTWVAIPPSHYHGRRWTVSLELRTVPA
jgi:hypothetical protein